VLLDPDAFRFTRELARGHATILAEFRALRREHFLAWPDRAAYGGTWLVAPLFMSSHYPGVDAHFAATQALCPRTTALLRAIPGVTAAVFSWQEPGCHIYAHRDVKALHVLRAHLPLEVPPEAAMRVGTQRCGWQDRQCLVFDGFVEHETGNPAATRRVLLMVDAGLDDAEFAVLQAWRARVGLVVDPKLVLVHPWTRATMA